MLTLFFPYKDMRIENQFQYIFQNYGMTLLVLHQLY